MPKPETESDHSAHDGGQPLLGPPQVRRDWEQRVEFSGLFAPLDCGEQRVRVAIGQNDLGFLGLDKLPGVGDEVD